MTKYKEKLIEKKADDPSQIVFDLGQSSSRDATHNQAGSSLSLGHDPSKNQSQDLSVFLGSNSRCVPVGTKPITLDGCNRKELFRAKRTDVKFRCSVYEKKLLQVKAQRSRLSVSEFCRRSVFGVEIKERLQEEHIEMYQTLVKFHNNFKSIGNMYRKRDPKLTATVYRLADEIKEHLENFKK